MKTTSLPHTSGSLPEERRLVWQAKSGDAEAFAQLYDAYVERVYRYIYFRVTDDTLAEDLTSQVFLKAWESLDGYQAGGSPYLAWLYTVAKNLVIDYYRSRRQTVDLDEAVHLAADTPTPDEEAQGRSEQRDMREALQRLTDEQQQVLILRFISGLSTEETAAAMGKRPGAVRALQMRALQTLSKHMQEKEIHHERS